MSIKEYLDNLYRLKNLAVDRWGKLTQLEREVFDESFDWLINNLEVKRGEITPDEELSRVMDDFVNAVRDIVSNNKGYQSTIGKFLQDLNQIRKNKERFHATAYGFDINTAGVNEVQKMVVNEIIDQYTKNGINTHFIGPLRDSIFRNILLGADMMDIRKVLQDYILSGQDQSGKLGRYLNQTAQQAVDSYSGAIDQKLVQTFTFTGYIISGSLIETSSKQCIYAVETSENGYLSFEDWDKVLEMARNNPKAKLIEGTTVENLPLNKLHWGCRHDFTPTVKKKDKKEEPKKEKQEQKPEPKKQGPFKEAKTKAEAKKIAVDIMNTNLELNITKVSASKDLPLDLFNRMNEVLNDLTSNYNISPTVKKGAGTELKYNSTSRFYGVVTTSFNGEYLVKINFGHISDTNRSQVYQEKPLSRFKSKVDAENEKLATVVHEFGHVISTSRQGQQLSNNHNIDFWNDIVVVQREYAAEIRSLSESQDLKNLEEIFIGNYANTNYNEFMAEAFTEYKLRKNPSKYAKKVGLLIDKYFKKK